MRWLILSLIATILLVGCTAQNISPPSEGIKSTETTQQQTQPQPTETSTETHPVTNEVIQSDYTGEVIAGATTKYIRYNKAGYDKALSEGKVIYFYFYANWCPICREERPKILEAFNEMSYPDVIGFEVHFNDNEVTEDDKKIAREFGISYQHTTVIHVVGVDKTGKEAFRSFSPVSKQTIKDKIASLV